MVNCERWSRASGAHSFPCIDFVSRNILAGGFILWIYKTPCRECKMLCVCVLMAGHHNYHIYFFYHHCYILVVEDTTLTTISAPTTITSTSMIS